MTYVDDIVNGIVTIAETDKKYLVINITTEETVSVLDMVKYAKEITQNLTIPTIGNGAGMSCDGQIQVFHDILGYNSARAPKHAMQYDNMFKRVQDVVGQYKQDVENS